LDKDTSGAIIAARTPETESYLRTQFASRRVKKEYIAISYGRPPDRAGNIKTYLARSRQDRKKYAVVSEPTITKGPLAPGDAPLLRGRFAHTAYRVVACYGPYTLFALRLKTGRTHQIRVHLAHLGCPLLGDALYGSPKNDALFEKAAGFAPTLMLHSRLLGLRLQEGAEFTVFEAPVPVRFKRVLRFLHRTFPKT
jgi:23S rRNA pseudouridine1911/1915/1917 synthase